MLYPLGISVMLAAMTLNQLNRWVAFAAWFVGLGTFVLGVFLEERTRRD